FTSATIPLTPCSSSLGQIIKVSSDCTTMMLWIPFKMTSLSFGTWIIQFDESYAITFSDEENTLPRYSYSYSSYMEAQVPRSDQPKSPGNTNTLSAFSMTAKSMEILTHRTNAPEMNFISRLEL